MIEVKKENQMIKEQLDNQIDLISIVIPVFKVEQYLERCIESVCAQTYKNIEIILVDDGSPDRCPEICDSYQDKDDRIIVIHQNNKGLSGARNTGILNAHGKYITFIDSDDYVDSIYVEQLYKTLMLSEKKISACSYTYKETELSDYIKYDFISFNGKESIKEVITEKIVAPSAWGKLYDICLFKEVLFPEKKLYEDYATTPILLHYANGMAYVDNKLYYYTYNQESITKSLFSNRQLQYFEIANSINEFVINNYPDLIPYAFSRDVNMSVSYYKKMSSDRYDNNNDYLMIINNIKKGIRYYLFSGYSFWKKMAAILILLFPNIMKRIFS